MLCSRRSQGRSNTTKSFPFSTTTMTSKNWTGSREELLRWKTTSPGAIDETRSPQWRMCWQTFPGGSLATLLATLTCSVALILETSSCCKRCKVGRTKIHSEYQISSNRFKMSLFCERKIQEEIYILMVKSWCRYQYFHHLVIEHEQVKHVNLNLK